MSLWSTLQGMFGMRPPEQIRAPMAAEEIQAEIAQAKTIAKGEIAYHERVEFAWLESIHTWVRKDWW